MEFTNLTRRLEIGANCYCLDIAGKRIVLDSGMHPKEEGINSLPNFDLLDERPIDAIFISHAHQDHIGTLPLLMRKAPDVPVFLTEATKRLSDVMLHNSVNVMVRKCENGMPSPPLFIHREVDRHAKNWISVPLENRFSIEGDRISPQETPSLDFEFYDAGHILGSVGIMIRAEGKNIFYTGDVNFEDQTLLKGANFPEEPLDVLIVETTRGDHPEPEGFTREKEEQRFIEALNEAFAQNHPVLLPLFALGKTQEILTLIYKYQRKGLIGKIPIHIGGLSTKLSEIYDKLAPTTARHFPHLDLLKTMRPSVVAGPGAIDLPIKKKQLYALSSGMMTEKTLSNFFARRVITDPDASLFFVGYADPDSPAGRIKATASGEMVTLDLEFPPQPLNCDVNNFNFSAHASRETLENYIVRCRPKTIILVHGDPPAMEWFRQTLSKKLPDSKIILPEPGKKIPL